MEQTRLSLLERVRNTQDQSAWGEFVALYEPLLLSYVRKKGVPDHDAGDVVQTIFISLCKALPTFRLDKARGRFRTWLWQVAVNAVTDRARRRNRAEGWGSAVPEPATTDPEPDAEWVADYQRRIYERAAEVVKSKTAEKTWACFAAHILEQRPGPEVGAELGLTANAVCANAARVIHRIRELCQEYMGEAEP
jgi:RNA polymerase sigma-70 factor (ECF subfamily)